MAGLSLTCTCGDISWSLVETVPRSGIRYICHCNDCQAFAHFVGRAADILDPQGGVDAYQLPASRLRFTSGLDKLACVHLTPRRLLRWYCPGCGTPVANTYDTSKLSFVSLPLCAATAQQRDRSLGPSSGHVWTKFGRGDLSHVELVSIPAMLWRMAFRIMSARLSGDYKNNPFFEPGTGEPIAAPRRLTQAERSELDRKVLAGA